jgi:RNA polymerase sigma factor (sigma-70 family)
LGFTFKGIKEEELYDMCKRGEQEAWQYVFNYIVFVCKGAGMKDDDDKNDMAQSIILNLLDGGLAKCKRKESFKTFLKVVTINRVIDNYRHARHNISMNENKGYKGKIGYSEDTYPGNDFIMNLPDTTNNNDPSSFEEILNTTKKILNKMTKQCKKILYAYFKYKLGYIEDYNELSELLKLPSGTISARVTRCLRQFSSYQEIKDLYESWRS